MTITSLETANNPTALAAGAAKSSSASKSAAFGFDFADMLSRVRVDSDAKLSILSTERSAQPLAEPEQRRDDAANTSAESDKAQNASDDTSRSDEKQAASDNGAGQQQQNAGQQQQGASASPVMLRRHRKPLFRQPLHRPKARPNRKLRPMRTHPTPQPRPDR